MHSGMPLYCNQFRRSRASYRSQPFALRTVHGLLHARHLHPVLYTDCSVVDPELEDPAVLNRRCVFRLPFGQLPVCTGVPPFSLAFRSTFRLASAIQSPALPSNSTSDSHRLPDSSASLPIDLQLAPSTNLPAQLSNRFPACAFNRSSNSAFQSTCDRRHLSIFRPAFGLTSSLRLRPIFRLSFPVHVRLAPSANVPALPSNLTSDSHRMLCSPGAALWLIRDRRRLSTLRPCLRPQPPTLIVRCIPTAAFRLIFGLRRRSTFQPRLRIQPSTHRLLCPFGAAFRLTCGSRRRSTLQPSLWTQPPTHRLPCSRGVRSG